MFWAFEFIPGEEKRSIRILTSSSKLFVIEEGDLQVVSLSFSDKTIVIGEFAKNFGKMYGVPGQICPIYFRKTERGVSFSNIADLLMLAGEIVKLDPEAVIQNLMGVPYPLTNIFVDFQLINASAIWEFDRSGARFIGSKVNPFECNVDLGDVKEIIYDKISTFFSRGQPICLLLSGGYDSRLNLALALWVSRKYGNAIHLFHEYKDEVEFQITRAIAQSVGIELHVKKRTDFKDIADWLRFDDNFIRLNSGCYRDNIIRWHGYLQWIKTLVPDGVIWGMGAEAHKGKFYKYIRKYPVDIFELFGGDNVATEIVAHSLGIKGAMRASAACLEQLAFECKSFSNLFSKIDYFHYQTYVSNGYGKRGQFFSSFHQIPFFFLDDKFLKAVFSLKREDKEGFFVVTDIIKDLNPSLLDIPFTSANDKARKERKVYLRISRACAGIALKARYYLLPQSLNRKGRKSLEPGEVSYLHIDSPKGDFTRKIKELLLSNARLVPFVRLDYLFQFYLYLRVLENKMGIEFCIKEK